MKKTTIKVSWDNAQALNMIASELSTSTGEKVTQDQVLRVLINFYKNGVQKNNDKN